MCGGGGGVRAVEPPSQRARKGRSEAAKGGDRKIEGASGYVQIKTVGIQRKDGRKHAICVVRNDESHLWISQ